MRSGNRFRTKAYKEVVIGWPAGKHGSWPWAGLNWLVRASRRQPGKCTSFVNAAVVGGPKNELKNPPIMVEL
ncbi:hypothetical protein BR93DRAFT_990752 [Coniochaeta sp. PMI_546]|nr:hypothetical protein BR93DRAFT_990752 [Coniochaeta sp. PMI_546]